MQEVDVDLLRTGDACARTASTAPSKTKQSDAPLGMFATTMFQKSEAIGSDYGTLL